MCLFVRTDSDAELRDITTLVERRMQEEREQVTLFLSTATEEEFFEKMREQMETLETWDLFGPATTAEERDARDARMRKAMEKEEKWVDFLMTATEEERTVKIQERDEEWKASLVAFELFKRNFSAEHAKVAVVVV